MIWIRVAAAVYFAIALYGVLLADDLPIAEKLYKVALLVGMIGLMLGWSFIFGGLLGGE